MSTTDVEIEVWHIPQIPGEPFTVKVLSFVDGFKLCNVLADYDIFQFEHRIKPDYSNANGVRWRHAKLTDGQWEDVEEDNADALWNDIIARLAAL